MADPLTLLRNLTRNKRHIEVNAQDFVLDGRRFPRNTPTVFLSSKGKGQPYTLEVRPAESSPFVAELNSNAFIILLAFVLVFMLGSIVPVVPMASSGQVVRRVHARMQQSKDSPRFCHRQKVC